MISSALKQSAGVVKTVTDRQNVTNIGHDTGSLCLFNYGACKMHPNDVKVKKSKAICAHNKTKPQYIIRALFALLSQYPSVPLSQVCLSLLQVY